MGFLLRERPRSMAAVLACLGLATMAPHGLHEVPGFLLSPAGVGIVALGLILIGVSVEESGTIRRIRLGIGIRLVAPLALALAATWALVGTAGGASSQTFGWFLFALGAAGVLATVRHDLSTFRDPGHGQRIRLEGLSPTALQICVDGDLITIPSSVLVGVQIAAGTTGRGIFIAVSSREPITGPSEQLPWSVGTRDLDMFLMDEYQAGIDVDVFAAKIATMASLQETG
jgi:hypothetical protein